MDETNQIVINERLSIPAAELYFRFRTSRGPGGQHANRSATRVTLFFDVANSPSLSDAIRARLMENLAARMDKHGMLSIDVQDSRSQFQNRETAVARFQYLLQQALKTHKPRRKTKPTRASKRRRLEGKKKRGDLKRGRSKKWRDD